MALRALFAMFCTQNLPKQVLQMPLMLLNQCFVNVACLTIAVICFSSKRHKKRLFSKTAKSNRGKKHTRKKGQVLSMKLNGKWTVQTLVNTNAFKTKESLSVAKVNVYLLLMILWKRLFFRLLLLTKRQV